MKLYGKAVRARRLRFFAGFASVLALLALTSFLFLQHINDRDFPSHAFPLTEPSCPASTQTVTVDTLKNNTTTLTIPEVTHGFVCFYSPEPFIMGNPGLNPQPTYTMREEHSLAYTGVMTLTDEIITALNADFTFNGSTLKCKPTLQEEELYLLKLKTGQWVSMQASSQECGMVAFTENALTTPAGTGKIKGRWLLRDGIN